MIVLTNKFVISIFQTFANINKKIFKYVRKCINHGIRFTNCEEINDFLAKSAILMLSIIFIPVSKNIYIRSITRTMCLALGGHLFIDNMSLCNPLIIKKNSMMILYVKYCNLMRKKHINIDNYSLHTKNDIMEFNKIKFHDGLKRLTINIHSDASDFVNEIIFPDTIEELDIISELNYFNSYTFNENIKTLGYLNYTGMFEKYDTINNLHIQNYVVLQNTGPKIDKIPYGCSSLYYDDYYDDKYCNRFHMT